MRCITCYYCEGSFLSKAVEHAVAHVVYFKQKSIREAVLAVKVVELTSRSMTSLVLGAKNKTTTQERENCMVMEYLYVMWVT